jgi:adenosyl cobinamide kinase/adenosyl cobinamide phosphate guanylyltransferase
MITLVLGGARSGKSEVAERLAARAAAGSPVTYVATIAVTDPDMGARIAAHQARRPEAWTTVEVLPGGDLPAVLASAEGVAIVDSLGGWVAGIDGFAFDGPALCGALREREGRGAPTVLVSEEVGLGVHPSSEAGRRFRDALGSLNRQVADVAGAVLLVVSGRVLSLPAEPGPGCAPRRRRPP